MERLHNILFKIGRVRDLHQIINQTENIISDEKPFSLVFGSSDLLKFDLSSDSDHHYCEIVGLLTKRTVYENLEPPFSPRLLAFQIDRQSFLTKFIVGSIKSIVESGIFEYLNQINVVGEYATLLRKWGNLAENLGRVNYRTFADLIVTGGRAGDMKGNSDPMLGHHMERKFYSGLNEEFEAGKLKDVMAVWVIYFGMVIICVGSFAFEKSVYWKTKFGSLLQ